MATTNTPKTLAKGECNTSSLTTEYTVPASTQALIRKIRIVVPKTATGTVTVQMAVYHNSDSEVVTEIDLDLDPGDQLTDDHDVLEAADELRFYASESGVKFRVVGAERATS